MVAARVAESLGGVRYSTPERLPERSSPYSGIAPGSMVGGKGSSWGWCLGEKGVLGGDGERERGGAFVRGFPEDVPHLAQDPETAFLTSTVDL